MTVLLVAQTRVTKLSKAATIAVTMDMARKRQNKAFDHPLDPLFNFGT